MALLALYTDPPWGKRPVHGIQVQDFRIGLLTVFGTVMCQQFVNVNTNGLRCGSQPVDQNSFLVPGCVFGLVVPLNFKKFGDIGLWVIPLKECVVVHPLVAILWKSSECLPSIGRMADVRFQDNTNTIGGDLECLVQSIQYKTKLVAQPKPLERWACCYFILHKE